MRIRLLNMFRITILHLLRACIAWHGILLRALRVVCCVACFITSMQRTGILSAAIDNCLSLVRDQSVKSSNKTISSFYFWRSALGVLPRRAQTQLKSLQHRQFLSWLVPKAIWEQEDHGLWVSLKETQHSAPWSRLYPANTSSGYFIVLITTSSSVDFHNSLITCLKRRYACRHLRTPFDLVFHPSFTVSTEAMMWIEAHDFNKKKNSKFVLINQLIILKTRVCWINGGRDKDEGTDEGFVMGNLWPNRLSLIK